MNIPAANMRTNDPPRRAAVGSRPAAHPSSVACSAAWDSPEFRQEWQALLETSDNLYAQYQTPEWFDHLVACEIAGVATPLAIRNAGSELVGIVPYGIRTHLLTFVARDTVLASFPLRAVTVMGGAPLARADADVHDRIYQELASQNPDADCLYLHSVRVGSFAWQHAQSSEFVGRNFILHLPRGTTPFHSLNVPETFEQYLQQFRAKKRYNLSRQVRLLRDQTGELSCERIDTSSRVPELLEAASTVLPRAWQSSLMMPDLYEALASAERLRDLADRKLLRSYVLRCGGTPRALVLGYQHNGIFHYAEIAYDRSLAQLSPGASLLYLLIQDLIEHDRPRCVNLGIGDAEYKRIFGNVHTEDATIILFRKTWKNRVRHAAHQAFMSTIRTLKARREAAKALRTDQPGRDTTPRPA